MKFQHYPPCAALADVVRHFVISEQDETASYKVLPDTSLVMGFQYRGQVAVITEDEVQTLSTAGITGLQNNYRTFRQTKDTGTVLVVFTTLGAAAFFKGPLHELFGVSTGLDDIIHRQIIASVEEQLQSVTTDAARIATVEAFLLQRRHSYKTDPLISRATAIIHDTAGTIRITDLAKQLHTSASPLEKKFRALVGATPKKYAAVVRFRHIIEANTPAKNAADRAYEAGYFDQAHFIRDFKRFTGETPGQYFSDAG